MIRQELEQLSVAVRDLRKFGLLVGGVLALLGGWFLFRHKPAWAYLISPGAILVLLALLAPRSLKQPYRAWMAMAFFLGTVVSTVILTAFYFMVVTPIALLGRLFGKDFLSQKLNGQAPSYWLLRDRSKVRTPAEYERQF